MGLNVSTLLLSDIMNLSHTSRLQVRQRLTRCIAKPHDAMHSQSRCTWTTLSTQLSDLQTSALAALHPAPCMRDNQEHALPSA